MVCKACNLNSYYIYSNTSQRCDIFIHLKAEMLDQVLAQNLSQGWRVKMTAVIPAPTMCMGSSLGSCSSLLMHFGSCHHMGDLDGSCRLPQYPWSSSELVAVWEVNQQRDDFSPFPFLTLSSKDAF